MSTAECVRSSSVAAAVGPLVYFRLGRWTVTPELAFFAFTPLIWVIAEVRPPLPNHM